MDDRYNPYRPDGRMHGADHGRQSGLFDPKTRLTPRVDPLDDRRIIQAKSFRVGLKVRCADGVVRTVRLVRDDEVYVVGLRGKVNPRSLTPV